MPRDDRTDLEVAVTFSGDWPEQILVQPPENCYGSGVDISGGFAIHQDQSSGEALPHSEAEGWLFQTEPGSDPVLTYSMSYDPARMQDAFAPNTSANHAHLAGCQWMARIGDTSEPYLYSVEISGLPDGWLAYSSWGYRGEIGQSFGNWHGFATHAIGGGAAAHRSITIEGSPVDIFVSDGFEVGAQQIADDITRLITLQREAMQVFDFEFFTATVNRRNGAVAGTAAQNLFVAFATPEIGRVDTARSISHEILHEFLPRRALITAEDDRRYTTWRWVHEGFTEFIARLFLIEAGIMDDGRMRAFLNQDLLDLADNAYDRMPVDELRRITNEDGLNQERMKLGYYQGALIAARWHHALRANGGSLIDLVRVMVATAADTEGEITPERFFRIASDMGIDARGDTERYFVEAEPILPPADYFPGYTLQPVEYPRFDLGFDLSETWREGTISGVDPAGPAYAAGLRDGMVHISLSNVNRHANSWDREAPVEVRIEAEGEPLKISYWPHGELSDVMQYRSEH